MTTNNGHIRAIPPDRLGTWLCISLSLLVLLLSTQKVQAGHASGVDISYECLSPCTYRIHFKAYRDCASSITTISPVNTLSISAGNGCNAPPQIGAWLNAGITEVTPVCPGTNTLCNSPTATINGVTEHYWIGDFDFCAANCSSYVVSWGICCRNSSITTMNGPQSTAIYTSTTINPLLPSCNSSPTFSNAPIPYICEGQSYVFAQGATDPDGDSLAYVLGPCGSGPSQSVPYFAWVSPQQPLTPDWNVQLDSLTGDLSLQPNPTGPNPGSIQVGVICIFVEEWRDGTLINTVQRDIQLTVVPCPNNDQPIIPGALNPVGATASGFQVSACYGASLCFTLRAFDNDIGQTQTITWDQSLAALGATLLDASDPSVADTIAGIGPSAVFCWTPPAPGTYSFAATITDDACPLYGFNQYTYTIHVTEIQVAAVDSGLGCDLAAFCAQTTTGTAPFAFNWMVNGIANTDSCFHQVFPGTGAYPYTLDVVDSAGCITSIQDTLNLESNVQAVAGSGTAVCAGDPFVLGAPSAPNANLVYQWYPQAGLSNPNAAMPTLMTFNLSGLPEFQTYYLSVTDTATNCTSTDSVTLLVNPIPEPYFALPGDACLGDSVVVSYAGSAPSTASFNWTFSNAAPATATGIGPHTIPWTAVGQHEVTLSVSQFGCYSPVFRDTVVVHDIPVATIVAAPPQCFAGHSFFLSQLSSLDSTATYLWSSSPGGFPPVDTLAYYNGLAFPAPGNYQAYLQVTENGCAGNPDTVDLLLHPDPDPNWSFSSGDQCFPANSFDFNAIGTNDTSAVFAWSFEDGIPATSSLPNPTVNFSSQGPKSVILFVSSNGCTSWFADTINVYPSPQVEAGADTSFCEGGAGLQLAGTVLGGNAPYSFQWWANSPSSVLIDSLADDDPFVTPANSMYLYVQVVDSNGCESLPDSVWLEMQPQPQVDAGPDASVCDGTSPCQVLSPTLSSVTGPYFFQWHPAAGLSNPNTMSPCALPDTTTTYTLVVTNLLTGCRNDAGGADSSDQVTISVYPQPIVEAGLNMEMCPGDSIQISGSGSGGGGPYTYEWSPTTGLSDPFAQSPMAAPANTTHYSLVAYSNGCPSNADTLRLEVHSLPIVDAGADVEICLGDSAALNGTVGGDTTATFTFSWGGSSLNDPSQEDPIAGPTSTTTYYMIAISNWGCESPVDSMTVFIYPTPIAEAGDSAFVCLGDEYTLPGSYYYGQMDTVTDPSQIYFNWSPSAGLVNPGLLQPSFVPSQSDWYTLSASYQTCITTDSMYLTVIPNLNPIVSADTTVICEGSSTQLHAGGGLGGTDFTWVPAAGLDDPSSPSPIASPGSSTSYTVYLEEYGCLDSLSIDLVVLPSPKADFMHTPPIGCAPHEVHFESLVTDPGAFLIWDFGDGSPAENLPSATHAYPSPGLYPVQLIAVNPGGCADTAAFLSIEATPPPRLNILSDPSFPAELYLPATEIHLEENFGEAILWQWEVENGERFEGQDLAHTFTEEGTFFISLTGMDEKGCWNDTLVGPFVVVNGSVELHNVFTPNGDGINDLFLAPYNGSEAFNMQIFDRWGVLLFETRNKLEGWDGTNQNGQAVPEGSYFYAVKIGQRDYSGSFSLIR